MYFKLHEEYAFRGWKQLPYAIRAERGTHFGDMPQFYSKNQFLLMLRCNGMENVDLEALLPEERRCLMDAQKKGLIVSSTEPMGELTEEQHYKVFPNAFLHVAEWSITGKCNYRCRHCLLRAPSGELPQLPLKDLLCIVERIKNAGIRSVDITGGEPLVHQDFLKLAEKLSEDHIRIRVLFTNGALMTEELLDSLERMHQHPVIQLSYDGVGHHDWLRNVPGAEEKLKQAIDLLHRKGYHYYCALCLYKGNEDSLVETLRYLADKGCDMVRVNTIQSWGNWRENEEEYSLDIRETWDVYQKAIEWFFSNGSPFTLQLDGFFQCKAGETEYRILYDRRGETEKDRCLSHTLYCSSMRYHAYIDAAGRLVPCMAFSDSSRLCESFSSLLTEGFDAAHSNVYYRQVVDTKVQDMVDRNPKCKGCQHLYHCRGGCMACGIDETGDYLIPDPGCCQFYQEIGVEAVRRVADAAIKRYSTSHFHERRRDTE